VFWGVAQRRDPLRKQHRAWFNRLRDLLGGGEGVSIAMRSTIVGASCTLTATGALDPERVRLSARIANYTYQQMLFLQRPQLSEPERLTAREHELLYRATVLGERPSDVAHQLGVKISTVRTLRQKAGIRLDAGSQEQAAWRMLETGQLFRTGRKSRPRTR
jgi:DNA-binding NarL/FixJ family response regulator